MRIRYWPNFFLMGAFVSGICGFTGLGVTPDQAAFARVLFCVFAVALVPFFVLRVTRPLRKERHG